MERHDRSNHEGQGGFSLIELMIAMVITLIVTGSIYGLMATGGNAFRRDPEITDRQQNLRVALDLITRDIDIAGMRMGPEQQAFTDGLDGDGPASPAGGNSDVLELLGNDGQCPDIHVTKTTGANIDTITDIPDCYPNPDPGLLFIVYQDGKTKWGTGHKIHSGDKINFPSGQQDGPTQFVCGSASVDVNCSYQFPDSKACQGPNPCPWEPKEPAYITQLRLVRYRIADDTDGIPSLYRSDTGGYDLSTGDYAHPPSAGWDLVARGIEDLQVQYLRESDATANNQSLAWFDTPGPVDTTGDNLDTVVRQVRVTLSARTVSTNLQGSVEAADGSTAIRGSMTVAVSPRAALFQLSTTGDMPWR